MKSWGIQQERIPLSSEKRCDYSRIARWHYFVGRIHVWETECSGNSIYLKVITKYLSQESLRTLDFNACVGWVAVFKGKASSCLLNTGCFGFRLKVSTEDFVVQLSYIYQNKTSWYNLLHTFGQSSHLVLCCVGGKCYFQASRMERW